MVLVDGSNKFTRDSLPQELLRALRQRRHLPSVLALNKVHMHALHTDICVTPALIILMIKQSN